MRKIVLILLVLSGLNSSAQSWCAPGATWRYNVLFIYGYIEFSYAGDTLINGMEAQVIDHYSVFQYPQPPPQPPSPPSYTYDPVFLITRTDGDLIFQWSQQLQTWDTLFWWGAQVGEGWTQAHGSDLCEPFEVLETGTMEVDGVELRWLDLNVSGRIVERIGSTWEFLPICPPGHIDGLAGLRCYSDDEIHYQSPGWSYGCTSLVGVSEADALNEYNIFPNPGTDHFTLQLPPGPFELTLFDAHGRQVLRHQLSEERPVISTSSLPAGIYHIRIIDRLGRNNGQRWVKN